LARPSADQQGWSNAAVFTATALASRAAGLHSPRPCRQGIATFCTVFPRPSPEPLWSSASS